MDVIQNAPTVVHVGTRGNDPQPSEHVMTLAGTVSLVVCFYLAVWVPLTIAFDDDDTAAILCPSLTVLVMEIVNISIVYEFHIEEDIYEKNLNSKYFCRWAVAACVCGIPTSVIMFVWTSSYGFLVIMSVIGVIVSSLKNVVICVYIAIIMCTRR